MSNDLGIDRSGNGNNWTVNNMAFADQVVDSPTNNFCTLNPLDIQTDDKLKEGNLYDEGGGRCRGTMAVSSGKWYFELLLLYQHHGTTAVGIREVGGNAIIDNDTNANFVHIQHPIGSGTRWTKTIDGTTTNGSEVSTMAQGDIIGVAFDVDAEEISWTKNGSAIDSSLTDFDWSGLNNMSQVAPYLSNGGGRYAVVNFGQDSSFAGTKTAQGNQDGNDIGDFYYTPPTGFLALCTKNLPDVAVVPSEHFNTLTYASDGQDGRAITGVGFAPDFVWFKNRTTANNHALFDAVRGATKMLESNTTDAEATEADGLESFDSDGFTVGYDSIANPSAGHNFVAWNWKANGSGSSNTNGSITSTVSANTDAGFSIVSYTSNGTTGATVGHGLSSAPEMIILKNRDDGSANIGTWGVFNSTIGNDRKLRLDSTIAHEGSSWWNSTTPTSSVFTIGSSATGANYTGNNKIIAYCFHSVDGYSKVGSYTGNGNADGTFVYTGFRPAFVMLKKTGNAANGSGWVINDSKRLGYNNDNPRLRANTSGQEDDTGRVELLSNGFKMRVNYAESNEDGVNFIYLAFAETPFKYSNAR